MHELGALPLLHCGWRPSSVLAAAISVLAAAFSVLAAALCASRRPPHCALAAAAAVYWLPSCVWQTMVEQCIDTVRPLELELHFAGEW